MLPTSWANTFTQALQHLNLSGHQPRLSIVGIGNELRGDDAAGLNVIRWLLDRVPANRDQSDDPTRLAYQLVEAGSAPENITGQLRRFQPNLILLVDAADLNAPPGSVYWIDWQQTAGLSASTHTLPLHVVSQYLHHELNAHIVLLGIQPHDLTLGLPLSPLVNHSVETIGHTLQDLLFSWKPESATIS